MTIPSEINTLIGVGLNVQAVTKSDSTTYVGMRAIYVGGTGDVAVVVGTSSAVTFVGVLAGSILPVAATKIMSTNTTATSMVAIF